MPKRTKDWYEKRLKLIKRLKNDDEFLKMRIEKQIQRHKKKIDELAKKIG